MKMEELNPEEVKVAAEALEAAMMKATLSDGQVKIVNRLAGWFRTVQSKGGYAFLHEEADIAEIETNALEI